MGYDIRITREDDNSEAMDGDILLEEWEDFVEQDPEMELDMEAYEEREDGLEVRTTDGVAIWLNWPHHQKGIGKAWFDHRSNCIIVKNPDKHIMGKMLQVAEVFEARVLGDEGEEYTAESLETFRQDFSQAQEIASDHLRPKRNKKTMISVTLILFLLLLAVLYFLISR